MHPDWLGSPQHFAAGLVLSAAVVWIGRSRGAPTWLLGLGTGLALFLMGRDRRIT